MTAVPQMRGRLLTIADYRSLPEDEERRWELLEGNLLISPSPRPKHMLASARLDRQLAPQLPGDLESVPDVDIDLELVPGDQPGTVRRPDLVVVRRDALREADESDSLLKANNVLIVVEIVSPGSRRMDTVVKRVEYADAGIPYYWIVDLGHPVSLLPCHLAGDFGYQDPGVVTGLFETAEPFQLGIDLDSLA